MFINYIFKLIRHVWKNHKATALSLFLLTFVATTTHILAAPEDNPDSNGLFTPGQTLNPNCLPGDCSVAPLYVDNSAVAGDSANALLFVGSGSKLSNDANLTWDGSIFTIGTDFGVDTSANTVSFNGQAYSWPSSLGDTNKFLTSDTGGILSWSYPDFTNLSGIANISQGGTGLSVSGTANQILGMDATGTSLEYKNILSDTVGTDFGVTLASPDITFHFPYASETNNGIVTTLAQTIAGLKTFLTLPQSSVSPLVADDFVNKAYVDSLLSGLSWKSPVLDITVTDPSTLTPVSGDRYIVAVGSIGDWSGQDLGIATYNGATWDFESPVTSSAVLNKADNKGYTFTNGAWIEFNSIQSYTAGNGLSLSGGNEFSLNIDTAGDDTDSFQFNTGKLALRTMSGLTPGSYTNSNITVDQYGRITLASDGAGGGGGSGDYTPQGVTGKTVGGLLIGTDLGTSPTTVQSILDSMLYPYIAPTISLSLSPATALREFGDNVASVTMNATTVKHSNPITEVTFYRGGSLINTVGVPLPAGGLETYLDSNTISTNGVLFTAKVNDGTTLVTSSAAQYTFVYPYYYGVGPSGYCADPAQIRSNFTPSIRANSASVMVTTSPVSQVYYFAYPEAYPALTSILDNNGFETISDYDASIVSITGRDSTAQSYRCYEDTIPTTQTLFKNTYKQ